jgi:hypothetical protein
MKKEKKQLCSECGKESRCKGLCGSCYYKQYRMTPKGKEQMKLYNETKGKEARERYIVKNRKDKSPKPPKVKCECGQMSVTKGYCVKCYQKYYQRKKNGFKGGKRGGKSKYNSDDMFKKVLSEVKRGSTIRKACKNADIDNSTFYRIINSAQKAELRAYKSIGAVIDDDDF